MRSFTISTTCNATNEYDKRRCDPHTYEGVTYQMCQRAIMPVFADSWISPSGYQYIVGMCGHSHAAQFHSNWIAEDEHDYAGDAFEKNGWIHFGLDYDCPIVDYHHVNPTQAQLDTLFDILMDARRRDAANDVHDYISYHQVNALDAWLKKNQQQY